MEARQQRGLEIAATANIVKKGGTWLVPSQSGHGRYTVCPDAHDPHCSCPDHETRGVKCKHIFAVEYAISREQNRDGSTTVTETVTVQQTVKRTYPQNWTAYNAAQTPRQARQSRACARDCRACQDRSRREFWIADTDLRAAVIGGGIAGRTDGAGAAVSGSGG